MQLEELSSVIHNALWSVENTEYLNDLTKIIRSSRDYYFNEREFLRYHFPYGILRGYELMERDFVLDTLSVLKDKRIVDSMIINRMLSIVKEIREINDMTYVSDHYYKYER